MPRNFQMLQSLQGIKKLARIFFCYEKDSLYRDPHEIKFDMNSHKFFQKHLPCPAHEGGKWFEITPQAVIKTLKHIRGDTWAYDCYGYEDVIDKHIEVTQELIDNKRRKKEWREVGLEARD